MRKSIDPMRRPEAAGGPLRALIVSMSFQPGIPWRVAPQQSPPPLPRPVIVSEKRTALETFFQRTAICPYLRCLTTGVQPRLSPIREFGDCHRYAVTDTQSPIRSTQSLKAAGTAQRRGHPRSGGGAVRRRCRKAARARAVRTPSRTSRSRRSRRSWRGLRRRSLSLTRRR